MTGWDHEFAIPFVNDGLFHVTDPGPLRAPILDFCLRRDEALHLILETKTAPDAKSAANEHPGGTVRITTETANLENIGGVKVRLTGILPYRVRTSINHRTGREDILKKPAYMLLKLRYRSAPSRNIGALLTSVPSPSPNQQWPSEFRE